MDANDPITDDEVRALFAPLMGAPIAVAVSGGADSMALMLLAARASALLPAPPHQPHPGRERVLVITVDHGLRSGSAEDAAWVASQAEALNLPCQVLSWVGDKPMRGVQAAARKARYRLVHAALIEEARPHERSIRQLLTGHHCEDQAETFLMRLQRGSGIDGLSAMQPTSTITTGAADTPLVIHRPLLGIPKSRLIATLKSAGIEWREDPSNARDDFERVRVRKALGTLAELGITSYAIARSAGRLARARTVAIRETLAAAAHYVNWHDGAFGAVPIKAFDALPDEITIRLLGRLISAFGGEAADAQLAEIEALAERIRATTARAWPARAATLGGCRLDWRPGGDLRVWREAGRKGLPTIEVAPGTAAVWDNRFRIIVAPGLDGPITVQALGAADWRALKESNPVVGALRLPPGAGVTLPACWRGESLLAVAGLPMPSSPLIKAAFAGDHASQACG